MISSPYSFMFIIHLIICIVTSHKNEKKINQLVDYGLITFNSLVICEYFHLSKSGLPQSCCQVVRYLSVGHNYETN